MSHQPDLTELARRAGRGDEEAFTLLYQATHKRIYYLARQILKDDTEALDVTQETFLRAWKQLPNLNYPEAVVTWLYRIADNQCKGRLRKNSPLLVEDLGEQAPPEAAEENEAFLPQELLDRAETKRLVQEIVDALPPLQRECIVLYYFAGLSVGEIAAQQDCPEGTVKSRLNYGRQQIKAAVLSLEKTEGTRLYTAAPLPLLLALFRDIPQGFLPDAETFRALWAQVAGGAGLTTAAAAGGAAAAGAQAGATAGAAAKAAGVALKLKLVAGALAVTVAVGGVAALLTADPAVTFTDPALETAVRLYLEQPSGKVTEEDVSQIYDITIIDDAWFFNVDALRNTPEAARPTPVWEGSPTTFSDLKQFSGLRNLNLKDTDLTDLSSLDGMNQLKKLGLYGLPDAVYQDLPDLPSLLHLALSPQDTCTVVKIDPAKPEVLHLLNVESGPITLDLQGQNRLLRLLAQAPLAGFDFLSQAEHLTYLSLSDGTGRGVAIPMAALSPLKELRGLELQLGGIDDLTPLAGLPALEAVLLEPGPGLTGDLPGLAALDNAPSMKYLYVWGHEGEITRCVSQREAVAQAIWDLYTAGDHA